MGSISVLIIGDDWRKQLEVVERDIFRESFFIGMGKDNEFLLKPGATGWDVNGLGQVTEVTDGYAGSARLSDIDLFAMQQKRINDIQERWDAVHRVVAGDTWISFADIRKKYPPQTEKYNAEFEHAARNEWFYQPAVQKVCNAGCTTDLTNEALDPILLPRADYVQQCTRGSGVLRFYDVIRHGEHLVNPNESELLAGLDVNELLTTVLVKY